MDIARKQGQSTPWLPQHVAAIVPAAGQTIAAIDPAIARPLLPGLDLWDMWPLQHADGATARVDGWTLWFVLSAPILPDPDARHHQARIRLVGEAPTGEWRDLGPALPDGLNPGSREWAGCAVYDPASRTVALYYTVAGLPGEAVPTFAQRLFATRGILDFAKGRGGVSGWSRPEECLVADGIHYLVVDQAEGVPGFIKGFRDPAYFRDPADGTEYLLFTGSIPGSASRWNGCIGVARGDGAGGWTLLPPLVTADGLNNEQERPHLLARGGNYYLFWSTQRKVFEPSGPSGPNGLYGMVADHPLGPYRPLNGTGLVAANPESAPFQCYSWWVNGEGEVAGFVDLVGIGAEGVIDDPAWRRAHFGGVPAPRFALALDGAEARVES